MTSHMQEHLSLYLLAALPAASDTMGFSRRIETKCLGAKLCVPNDGFVHGTFWKSVEEPVILLPKIARSTCQYSSHLRVLAIVHFMPPESCLYTFLILSWS